MNVAVARIRAWWETADPTRRLVTLVTGVGVLVALIALVFWSSTPEYAVLYSGLSPQDASSIADRLKTAKISYRLNTDSTTIEVPTKHKSEALLLLAKEKLPAGSAVLGYKRLESVPFGQTQDMQQESLRVMQEEEIQRVIERLSPVETAQVKINSGSTSPFLGERQKASASVVVHTRPGEELSPEQVQGIVFIVSRGTEGLGADTVAVMDGTGRPLWDGSRAGQDGAGMATVKQDAELSFKTNLEKEIQAHLDTVVGPGKSSVMVRAELNYDKVNETKEEVTPGATISEQVVKDEMDRGSGAMIGGPTGAASNSGIPTTIGGGGADSTYKSQNKIVNNEVNRMRRTVEQAPGKVEQLSVAVFLDESVQGAAVTGIRQFLNTIAGVGTDPSRAVTIQTVAFDRAQATSSAAAVAAAVQSRRMEQMMQLLPMVALALVGVLILRALGRNTLRLASGSGVPALAGSGAYPSGYLPQYARAASSNQGEIGDGTEAGQSEGGVVIRSAHQEKIEIEEIPDKIDPVQEQLSHMAATKPEQMALLIKGWMTEAKK